MVKELRTQSVDMKLHRSPKIQGTSWGLTHVQPFFPPLETLFKTERLSNLSEYGVKLPEEVETVVEEMEAAVPVAATEAAATAAVRVVAARAAARAAAATEEVAKAVLGCGSRE